MYYIFLFPLLLSVLFFLHDSRLLLRRNKRVDERKVDERGGSQRGELLRHSTHSMEQERERGGGGGRGGDERGAAKGGRRERARCECGPPMACEPTKVPHVRYFGIKAKQPLLDVTHEAASAHPGVPDYVRTRLHVVGARRSQGT